MPFRMPAGPSFILSDAVCRRLVSRRAHLLYRPCRPAAYTWDEQRMPLSPYAKGAAYMGLATVTPIAGWIGHHIGAAIDASSGTHFAALTGLLIGCAAGMYETFCQALKIEGFDKRGKKDGGPDKP
jgi:hypothetical protein